VDEQAKRGETIRGKKEKGGGKGISTTGSSGRPRSAPPREEREGKRTLITETSSGSLVMHRKKERCGGARGETEGNALRIYPWVYTTESHSHYGRTRIKPLKKGEKARDVNTLSRAQAKTGYHWGFST